LEDPGPGGCLLLGPGFLLNRGEFTTIDHPDAVLETAPYGINDRGQIVGLYERISGQAVEARGGGRNPERRASSEDLRSP
jgi:hypothetical protein